MARNELAKTEEIKEYLKITVENDAVNSVIDMLAENCQARILTELGRNLFKATYSNKYYDIDYPTLHVLKTKEYPIVSISEIVENTSTLTEDTNFKVNYSDGEIYRIAGENATDYKYWKEGRRIVKISYVAGHNPNEVPACLKEAFLDYCYWKFYHRDGGAIESVSLGGSSLSGSRIQRGKMFHGLPESVYYSILPEISDRGKE